MRKRIWVLGFCMVLCTTVSISGCGIRSYQAERAEAVLGRLFGGSAQEKEELEGKEEEQEEKGQEGIQGEKGQEDIGEEQENTEEEKENKEEEQEGAQKEEAGEAEIEGQEDDQKMEAGKGQEEFSYQTKYVINCKKSITLRESPSTSAAQVEEILWGEPVSFIKDDANGFSKVAYQGKTGYVLAAYLGDTAPTVNDSAYYTMRVVNCRESISLRKSPSVNAEEICQIPLGSIVSYVNSSSDGFYEITYLGRRGYALASYLEFYSAQDNASLKEGTEGKKSTGAVRVSFNYFIENGREGADIIGLDAENRQVWQYAARALHGATELESVQEIGVAGDAYYFNEDGTIVALALEDGRVLWKNEDFGGASISFALDEEGILYLCGYYGPDLCVIDQKGNTLVDVESLLPNFQWPHKIRYENRAVYITGYINGEEEVVVRYDLTTGGISYE